METADGTLWIVSGDNILTYNRQKDALENNGKDILKKLGIKETCFNQMRACP